jgi:hypothetical protein
LIDGVFVPVNYSAADIVLLSSIAPTAFMSKTTTDPHDVDFHLWVGAADADVSGCAQSDVTQSFQLFGRAEDQRQSICLYGVGHAWFHNGGGSAVATGPCLLNQALTHNIVRGHLLPLVEYHVRGNRAGLDYLWRSYEDLHPPSVSLANPCVVVNQQFRADGSERYVIEDFQTQPDPLVASSGALITADFPNYATNILQASNNSFTYNGGDPFTGTTYAQNAGFERAGAVDFSGTDASLSFDLAPAGQDWTGYAVLSLRAARATRHPSIPGNPGDAHFEIRVVDAQGDAATVSTADLGNGLRAPYARTGCGTGTGWASEFETVRVSLQALRAIQPALDLDAMDRVELLFGPSHGEPSARLTFDDLELSTR